MDASRPLTPDLGRAEWELVAELLRRELRDLPAEIHHTDSRDYRDDLHRRRDMVVLALGKIEPVLQG